MTAPVNAPLMPPIPWLFTAILFCAVVCLLALALWWAVGLPTGAPSDSEETPKRERL